jgi:hypothetical protein
MTRHRGRFAAAALSLAAVAFPGRPAGAQAAPGPPIPKPVLFPESWPGVGHYACMVDNFNGIVAVARIGGTGTDNNGNTLTYDADIRVMQGVYVGSDGFEHRGTFVFT